MAPVGRVAVLGCCALVLAAPQPILLPSPLPGGTPETVGLSSDRLQRVTHALRDYVARGTLPGVAAAVARKGKLAYLETLGVQDVQTKAPITDRSIFRIYSMTKAITAVAAMTLYEEGRFQLNDPVAKYLPEFREVMVSATVGPRRPMRAITVRDLLLHTSGLNHRTSAEYRQAQPRSRRWATARVVENFARLPLAEDPGTRWRYSEAPTVVGRLIEVWSGKALDEFLDERLFQPLRMVDTGFVVRPDQRARLTAVHVPGIQADLRPIELEDVPFTEPPALLEGAVGLVSTLADYLRFCQMLSNKGHLDGIRILGRKTVEMITVNAIADALLPIVDDEPMPGMGWALANVAVVLDPREFSYPVTIGEYGWGGSAGTRFWVDPREETIAIIMAPISPANPESLRERFKTLVYQSIID